jgi:hypothetical protein
MRLVEALGELLQRAHGQPFCDGCLAVELGVERLAVHDALDEITGRLDRGYGRCCVCGQTLMVTRTPTP